MRAPEWNDPEEFVVSLMTCPVDTLVIAIWAPATTAPEGSLTVPTMLPVPTVVWVNDRGARLKSANPARSGRTATDESFIALTVISHRAYGGRPTRRSKSLYLGSERRGSSPGSRLRKTMEIPALPWPRRL